MTTGESGYSESLSFLICSYLISNARLNAGYPRVSEDVMRIRERVLTRVRFEAAEELARDKILS